MKFIKKVVILFLAAYGMMNSTAIASPIFFNTGVDDAGNPLAGGTADSHYTFNIASQAVTLSQNNYWGTWANPGDARWIYNADTSDSGYRGWGEFTTTIDLTGYDPATAKLSGLWAADQYGYIFLNGQPTDIAVEDGNWDSTSGPGLSSFSIASGFKAGVNTLTFNIYLPEGGDGLLVTDANITAQAVPEPETYVLLLAGLGTVGLARRKIEVMAQRLLVHHRVVRQ